jgi:CHC2 zinc finger
MNIWANAPPERAEWAAKARAVRIEDELARRGFDYWTKPRHSNIGQPCPMCGGTDRFSVNTKKQVFNCRGCGQSGDVIDLVQTLDGCGYLDAIAHLAGDAPERIAHSIPKQTCAPAKQRDEKAERQRKIDVARAIWQRRQPIVGTLAERYLRTRGLDLDEDHLRYMGFDPEAAWREVPNDPASPLLRVPCLLAAFRDIYNDEIVAVQKTRLAEDGSKLGRRFNGCPKGAVIKIDPDENVTMGLAIGEGLETCLSARALGFRPAWAAGTAGSVGADGVGRGGIAGFPVLGGIESLTVFLEHDESGANAKAVQACADRWIAAGKEVFSADPPPDCGDMNAVLTKGMARA